MKLTAPSNQRAPAPEKGSVLILVLWISFGLVVLALHFAHSMGLELRAAENRVAALEASHAIQGAVRYTQFVLSNNQTNGALPDPLSFLAEQLPIGNATAWFTGRPTNELAPGRPVFGFVDESSKINLNTASRQLLEALPRMTPQLAGAIIDWRDEDLDPQSEGAEDEVYARLQPPRRCKNARFESVDELRLVYGAELDILFGEDMNRNGVLDPNEDDGDRSPPIDNRDGRLDPGLLELTTVYSSEPNTRSDGSRRINLTTPNSRQDLSRLFQEKFGAERANQILAQLPNNANIRSLLEFFVRTQMKPDEFDQVQRDLTVSNGATVEGLINVNTAPVAVLAAIPGIGLERAPSLAAFRESNPSRLTSVAWVADLLDADAARQAGPFLTASSYQLAADVAAVGRHGRGFQRARIVFDASASGSSSAARIVHVQDLTALGWPLGERTREELLLSGPNAGRRQR